MGAFPLHALPEELLQSILDYLAKPDLLQLSLASRWCREIATSLAWRQVELVDCRTFYTESGAVHSSGPGSQGGTVGRIPAGAVVRSDEHDDTPLIRKLWVLATQPWIAASVHTVTHRCHLSPPAIFNELPKNPFSAQTLSIDPRTIYLLKMAVRNMRKVCTLRIIFGHPRLSEALLRCFFDASRDCDTSIRKLWLESINLTSALEPSVPSHKYNLPLDLDFSGLSSVRLRRLPLHTTLPAQDQRLINRSERVYARGGTSMELQNGLGGHYLTTINTLGAEVVLGHEHLEQALDPQGVPEEGEWPLQRLMNWANNYDDKIYARLTSEVDLPPEIHSAHIPSHLSRSILAYQDHWQGPVASDLTTSPSASAIFNQIFRLSESLPTATSNALTLFRHTSSTLTSLTIDWCLTMPPTGTGRGRMQDPNYEAWVSWYAELFGLRFPALKAFQYRNAVVRETVLPPGLFLLDQCTDNGSSHPSVSLHQTQQSTSHTTDSRLGLKPLEFMEAHPNLQCLAWPMDQVFSPTPAPSIAKRVQGVVEHLGRRLRELRVDTLYSGSGEYMSDETASGPVNRDHTLSRRHFLTHLAAHLHVLHTLKIEGGMPRDERRETIRALRHSPLKKIVLIGVCSPLGNTWGAAGQDLDSSTREEFGGEDLDFLEAEDKSAIFATGHQNPNSPSAEMLARPFEARFGWRGEAPMLHTLVVHHAETIRELKFCGYKGSPLLWNPTAITTPLLFALRHCHNLESLILSLWLSTWFEDAARDDEVIAYWLDCRSSSSTALAPITPSTTDGSENAWARALRTTYAPQALAERIVAFIGPFLSEEAKGRRGGVHVRGSFCLGDWGGIFDVDVRIGKAELSSGGVGRESGAGRGKDVCLSFDGPREELERGRREGKLEGRGWF